MTLVAAQMFDSLYFAVESEVGAKLTPRRNHVTHYHLDSAGWSSRLEGVRGMHSARGTVRFCSAGYEVVLHSTVENWSSGMLSTLSEVET